LKTHDDKKKKEMQQQNLEIEAGKVVRIRQKTKKLKPKRASA